MYMNLVSHIRINIRLGAFILCVWKPTTNKLFTDRVLGISSIEFRKINPVL